MLEIKNWEVCGLERSIVASGNPMTIGDIDTASACIEAEQAENGTFNVKGTKRSIKLGSAPQGSGHDNFLSGIDVYYDVKYSLYWTPEFQRYHFNQIISSQSKMHKLIEMTKDDNFKTMFNKYVDSDAIKKVDYYISTYLFFDNMKLNFDGITYSNDCLEKYTKEAISEHKYFYFMKALSNLPAGFEMWMTIKTNYLQLKTMYKQRCNHKLIEDWGAFCNWCLILPKFKELTGV
jgi:hypothetical protein